MRYLGVDPGGKRMGLAIGDLEQRLATPLEVVAYHGVAAAADVIVAAAARHGATAVVLGLPLDSDGRRVPACRRSELLADAVAARGLTVELQGEYLTSDEARRRARSAGLSASAAIDHLAAQVILEDFFAARDRPPQGG